MAMEDGALLASSSADRDRHLSHMISSARWRPFYLSVLQFKTGTPYGDIGGIWRGNCGRKQEMRSLRGIAPKVGHRSCLSKQGERETYNGERNQLESL